MILLPGAARVYGADAEAPMVDHLGQLSGEDDGFSQGTAGNRRGRRGPAADPAGNRAALRKQMLETLG